MIAGKAAPQSSVTPTMMKLAAHVVAFAVISLCSGTPARAQVPSGMWQGRSFAERSSDLRWVTNRIEYSSDFWFVLTPDGVADGFAIARYTMTLDDGRLRDVIATMRSAGSSAVG